MSAWKTEKDRYLWRHEDTGYVCQILRHKELLHLCGYVIIPPNHRLKGMLAGDFEDFLHPYHPHGGVTYARTFKKTGCTKVGFDCAHGDDLCPGYINFPFISDDSTLLRGSYRDAVYVANECEALAKALKKEE